MSVQCHLDVTLVHRHIILAVRDAGSGLGAKTLSCKDGLQRKLLSFGSPGALLIGLPIG